MSVSFSDKDLDEGQFWVGLINPDNNTCDDKDCESKLKWASDGSNFESWPDTSHGIRANDPHYCLRYRDDGSLTSGRGLDDKGCDSSYYYVCEFQCPITTTTTTIATTTEGL